MTRIMSILIAVSTIGITSLSLPADVTAQGTAVAVVPSQPVIAYYPHRAGLFGRRIVYRPHVALAAPVVVAPVATTAFYAPATPVTTYYAPAPPVMTHYAPAAPVTTYYAPAAPVTTYYAPAAPVTTYYAPTPVTTFRAPLPSAPHTMMYTPTHSTTIYRNRPLFGY